MPGRAFIPGPLSTAQPRVYKSMRGRQITGLLMAVAGTGLGLTVFGASTLLAYALTFALAVPGFAYGYFQPDGRPVEQWLRVLLRFYLGTARARPPLSMAFWRNLWDRARTFARALRRASCMRANQVHRRDSRRG